MRCLDAAGVDVVVDAQEYESSEPGAPEELHSEYVREGELDVGQWAHDQVALSLPEPLLCRPDCAGLCPVCGKNLNEEPHVHEEVVRAYVGRVDVTNLEDFRSARAGNDRCAHALYARMQGNERQWAHGRAGCETGSRRAPYGSQGH